MSLRSLDGERWACSRFVDLLCPNGKGLVVVLEAYLDESEREGGIFCVAGYLFEPDWAKEFSDLWIALHEPLLPSHMTDLATGGGIYKGIPDKHRNGLVEASVGIINRQILSAVVVSCDVREVKQYAPSWIRSFNNAYSVCCHVAMTNVGRWLRDQAKRPDKVTYVFETGNTFEAEAHDLIHMIGRHDPDLYRYYGHAFQPKADFPPLQAADLYAWEWTKFMDETVARRIRPPRGSFRSLIQADPTRYFGQHLTGQPLKNFMAGITELGLEQLREEREDG